MLQCVAAMLRHALPRFAASPLLPQQQPEPPQ